MVVSPDEMNRHIRTAIVAPMTTTAARLRRFVSDVSFELPNISKMLHAAIGLPHNSTPSPPSARDAVDGDLAHDRRAVREIADVDWSAFQPAVAASSR